MTAKAVALVRIDLPDENMIREILSLGEKGLVEVLHIPLVGFDLVVAVPTGDGNVRFYNLGPIVSVILESVNHYMVTTDSMEVTGELLDPLEVRVNTVVRPPFPWQ